MIEVEWWQNGLRRALDSFTGPKVVDVEASIARSLDRAVAALAPVYELRVVCTDKGQHSSALLGVIARQDGAETYEFGTAVPRGRDQLGRYTVDVKHDNVVEHREGVHGDLVRWRCPRCRRDEPWKWERAQGHAAGLETNGVTRLDISTIPH